MNTSTRQCVDRPAMAIAIVSLLMLASCGGGGGDSSPSSPPPLPAGYTYGEPAALNDGWRIANAGDLGVSVPMLERMIDVLPARFDIVDSIAIAYQGELIFDETVRTGLSSFDQWGSNSDLDIHVQFSVSKSIASLAIGVAIDQGLIGGVDVRYLGLFPYAMYANWDTRKQDIRLEDVLTMRMGLQWDEWDPPYSSPNNAMAIFSAMAFDFSKALLDLPMADDPGVKFVYTTPASISLGQAIQNSGPLSLTDFVMSNLFDPLDITDVGFIETPTGLPDLGRGLFLRTRDVLKFGQMYADGGTWNGQRIISEAWVAASTQVQVSLGWLDPDQYDWKLSGYGYQWWAGYFEVDGREIEAYAARGYGQQVLMVVPELELVVAVNSHAWAESDAQINQVFRLINTFIIPALP